MSPAVTAYLAEKPFSHKLVPKEQGRMLVLPYSRKHPPILPVPAIIKAHSGEAQMSMMFPLKLQFSSVSDAGPEATNQTLLPRISSLSLVPTALITSRSVYKELLHQRLSGCRCSLQFSSCGLMGQSWSLYVPKDTQHSTIQESAYPKS